MPGLQSSDMFMIINYIIYIFILETNSTTIFVWCYYRRRENKYDDVAVSISDSCHTRSQAIAKIADRTASRQTAQSGD